MAKERNLYRVRTQGCGEFYVVATSFDSASEEVYRELNSQDYGYSFGRTVVNVELIRRQMFMSNGKQALYGDNDINKLIIVED